MTDLTDDLVEELLAKQSESWRTTNPLSVEAILASVGLSAHQIANQDHLLALICNEVGCRTSQQQKPELVEYQERFPTVAGPLSIQWEIDRFLLDTSLRASDETFDSSTITHHHTTISRNALMSGFDSHEGEPSVSAVRLMGLLRQNEPQSASSASGSSDGRYELRRELGRGSVGIVFEAWDRLLKRKVALKRLRAGTDAGEEELLRIRLEAEAIAKINHTHIVQIYDFGTVGSQPFIAMEYCEGGNLAERLQGDPIGILDTAQLGIQLANGLSGAHALGVIHRDLKPANVLLARANDWHAKISDFGLSKSIECDLSATATGSILGTPTYMSPEQALGDSKKASPASDIYSLGAILYECLTGRPPFRGSSLVDTLDQVRNSEPARIRQLEPKVPIDLETIVHKCLRKSAAQRYARAEELSEDLRRCINKQPILARRESWLETVSRLFQRYPVVSSLSAATVLLLLTITAGSLVFASRLNTLFRESQLGQAEALVGRAHGTRLSRKAGQRFQAIASIRQAANIGRKLGQPKEWYEPLRDEAITALMLPDAYVEKWHQGPEVPFSADFRNDHQQIAVSYEELSDVILRKFDDHSEQGRIPKLSKQTRVQFIDNERLFLHGAETQACELWDVSRPTYTKLWRIDTGCVFANFSNDGRFLVITDEHWMQVIATESGKLLSRFPSSPYSRSPICVFHPNEPLMACFSYYQPALELRNWKTGETIQRLQPDGETSTYSGADWTPDGKRLVVVHSERASLHSFHFNTNSQHLELVQTMKPSKLTNGGDIFRFNVQGDRILATGWTSCLQMLDSDVNSALFSSLGVAQLGKGGNLPRIDPSEKYSGFSLKLDDTKKLGLVSIAPAREAKMLLQSQVRPFGQIVDPTGRFLLGANVDGMVIVEAKSGRPLATIPLKDYSVWSYAFDRRGNFYLTGQAGNYRWPYTLNSASPFQLKLGIPERVQMPFGALGFSCSEDGRTIAGAAPNGYGTQEYAGDWIKSSFEPAARKIMGGQTGLGCSVTRDGYFVAGWSDRILVRDCDDAIKPIQELPNGAPTGLNSKENLLVVGGKLFRTDTWTECVSFKEGVVSDLSPDGTQVLFERNGLVGLSDTRTGKTLARFEWHEPLYCPKFFPDGEKFVCSNDSGVMMVDLRQMRQSLAKEGLDWDAPSYPSTAKDPLPRIESVQLHPALQGIDSMEALAELVDNEALAKSEQQVNDPYAAFNGAMVFIERYDYASALKLLDKTCKLLPESITSRQWRAYLHAALGNFHEAIEDANWVLERIEEPDFRMLRAEWLCKIKRYEAAIADCTRIIDDESFLVKFVYGLQAACHESLGNRENAAADQAEFLELTRFDSTSLNLAAEPMSGSDISLRHPVLALRIVRKLQSLKEEPAHRTLYTMARVMYLNELYDEAMDNFETNLSKGCGDYLNSNLYGLAMVQHRLGLNEQANESFDKAEKCELPESFDYRARRNLRILRAECVRVLSAN